MRRIKEERIICSILDNKEDNKRDSIDIIKDYDYLITIGKEDDSIHSECFKMDFNRTERDIIEYLKRRKTPATIKKIAKEINKTEATVLKRIKSLNEYSIYFICSRLKKNGEKAYFIK